MRPTERNDPSALNHTAGMVSRIAALLTAFSVQDRELSGAELARRTGLPRSSAHRIVAELVEEGLLERTDGKYQLGMRMFELGQLAPRQRGLREAAAPFLADLREATKQTVHLAVLDGVEVVYLEIIHTSSAPVLRSRLGGRVAASITGVGKAILASSPPEAVETVIEGGLPRVTRFSISDPAAFRAELAEIRATGIALDNQEQAIGTSCCASAILGPERTAIGAVSVAGHTSSLHIDRVATAVRSTALGISRIYGGHLPTLGLA